VHDWFVVLVPVLDDPAGEDGLADHLGVSFHSVEPCVRLR
jgi:hypothetical protein